MRVICDNCYRWLDDEGLDKLVSCPLCGSQKGFATEELIKRRIMDMDPILRAGLSEDLKLWAEMIREGKW